MKVEMRKLADIKPYEGNPRQNDAAVDAVAASIEEFGFRQPLVLDEQDVIIVGHTRWKAAKKLGLEELPCHVAVGLSPEQARAYRIADNQTATIATWDDDKLALELIALQDAGFDLNLTGFSDDQLQELMFEPREGQTDPDAVPEPPDEATTKPGDLWILGNHRLLCGDSSKAEDVDRLLDGAVIHLVNCDPPYGVKVEPRSNNAISAGLSSFAGTTHHQKLDVERHPEKRQPTTKKLRAKDRPLANDFVSDEEFEQLLHLWFANLSRVLLPGRGFYIWGGYPGNPAKVSPCTPGARPVFLAGDHLGQAAPGADEKGLHGLLRNRLLRVERRRRPPVLRPRQRHRPVGGQEGQPAVDDPPHGEARRVGGSRHRVLVQAR